MSHTANKQRSHLRIPYSFYLRHPHHHFPLGPGPDPNSGFVGAWRFGFGLRLLC